MTTLDSKMLRISRQSFYILLIVCIASICPQGRVNAQQSVLQTNLQASSTTPAQTASLEDRVKHLEERVQKAEGKSKDFWDKLSTASGLISGVLIASIGIWATNAYKRREIEISQVQTVQSFMPYLQSKNPRDVRRALRVISILGNEALSIALTLEYPEEISIPALAKMASSPNPTEAVQGEETLENLYQRTYPSLSTIRQEFLKHGSEYQAIRETIPAGSERTSKMESTFQRMKDIVKKMKETVLPLLQEFTNRTSMGAQLAAISILQVQPNIDFLDWLARKIAADPGSFHGYHAAVALRKAAEVFGNEHREAVQEAINLARRLASEATRGADAFRELDEA